MHHQSRFSYSAISVPGAVIAPDARESVRESKCLRAGGAVHGCFPFLSHAGSASQAPQCPGLGHTFNRDEPYRAGGSRSQRVANVNVKPPYIQAMHRSHTVNTRVMTLDVTHCPDGTYCKSRVAKRDHQHSLLPHTVSLYRCAIYILTGQQSLPSIAVSLDIRPRQTLTKAGSDFN
jgi:hypothetical protein